jgi:hypothetical protein
MFEQTSREIECEKQSECESHRASSLRSSLVVNKEDTQFAHNPAVLEIFAKASGGLGKKTWIKGNISPGLVP